MSEYIITAFSPSANTTQRELQLMNAQPTDPVMAQRLADSFAQRQTERGALGATDWVGRIELVDARNFRTL